MNARATTAAAAAMQQAADQAEQKQQRSFFEQPYHQFSDDVMDRQFLTRIDATPYLRDLNRIAALTAGLGVVLRIVSGNCVVADQYDPSDSGSSPPLSRSAINMLTNMAAEICELITDDIGQSAESLEERVQP